MHHIMYVWMLFCNPMQTGRAPFGKVEVGMIMEDTGEICIVSSRSVLPLFGNKDTGGNAWPVFLSW